jgi:hypothetical protein
MRSLSITLLVVLTLFGLSLEQKAIAKSRAAPRNAASPSFSTDPRHSLEDGKFGLGLMAGTMSAVTGNYWITPHGSIDFGFGFDWGDNRALYADYLWHIPGMFGHDSKFGRESYGYFGGGAGMAFWESSHICGRWNCARTSGKTGSGVYVHGMFGVEWYPLHTRFGVFGETGPVTLLSPSNTTTLEVGAGGRYYF